MISVERYVMCGLLRQWLPPVTRGALFLQWFLYKVRKRALKGRLNASGSKHARQWQSFIVFIKHRAVYTVNRNPPALDKRTSKALHWGITKYWDCSSLVYCSCHLGGIHVLSIFTMKPIPPSCLSTPSLLGYLAHTAEPS